MTTAADRYTDKTFSQLESRISNMYKEAQKDLRKKLEDFTRRHRAKDAEMRRKLKAGEITQAQYQQWMIGQVFVGNQWKQKIEQINNSIKHVMQNASNLTHGKSMDVFAENANYTAYQLEKDLKANINFGLYDTTTVSRLVGKDPEILPRRVVDGEKLDAWETKKISNAISQGIIQGESIDQIADRIARDTCIAADKSSIMYARTAMTCAQNAGRLERLHEAEDMGINVKKRWMATLDDRTRDSHRDMDGETVDVDEKFSNGLMYPGDPATNDFAEICNCRCTMVYVYPEFTQSFERSASLGYDEEGHHQYETVKDMTYQEWAKSKKSVPAPVSEPERIRPRHANFTPAQSIQEAQEYAGRFLSYNGKASYRGIDLEYANVCNQVLSDIQATYDVLGLGSIAPMNMQSKLFKNSTAEAAYRWGSRDLFINPKYYKNKTALSQHKQEIDKLMQTVLGGGQQLLNSGKLTDTKRDYVQALLNTGRQCVAQSHDFVEGTFVHECGHRLDDAMFFREIRTALGGTNTTGADLLANSRRKYGGGISGYAISNNQEYVAESFAAWWYGEGDKCDPAIVEVFERMVKHE